MLVRALRVSDTHDALSAVRVRLRDGEKVFAFLDGVHEICVPWRVMDVHKILEEVIYVHKEFAVDQTKSCRVARR